MENAIEMNRIISVMVTVLVLVLAGCSSSEQTVSEPPKSATPSPSDELALKHFLEGSTLEQQGDFAKAILEYQDALSLRKDPAVYHAIARCYSVLEKHALAITMGTEAVRLEPSNRTYRETLAEIQIGALNLEEAGKQFEEIIRLDSSYQPAWRSLARIYQLRSPLKAIGVYQTMLNRFGPDFETYFQLAQIYSSLNQLDKATDALRGMLTLDPGNFEIKKTLGDAYLRQDSVEAALAIYNELAELYPDNLELRASIAHSYLVTHDYDRAAEQFERVMRKDTLSVDDQLRFGQIFVSFVQKDSAVVPYAIELFQKVQTAHPEDWRTYWFLGALHSVTGNDSLALLNYQHVKSRAAWNPDGWLGIASIYYEKNRFEEAIDVLNEATRVAREEPRVYFLLGISYQRLHRNVEAGTALEKSVQLNDKNVEALSALALVYDEMNRHEDSDSIYERALRLDPSNHLLLNNYGYSLAERGIQLQRALKMSKEAVSQQPANESYLDTYGWVYYRMGEYEEAERYIQKAIEHGSRSAVVHEHMGDICFKLGKHDEALRYWRKALELSDGTNDALRSKIERGSL
jgi:tetratricopeptide (TPR) repeat protein